MEQSFIAFLEDSIKKNWDLDALTDYKGATLQYKDVARKIEKLHIIFELSGIKQGDKIAVCGRNSSHWGVTFLAAVTYGAVIVPILHEFKSDNIHNIVNHSEARLLMVGDMVWENLNENAMPLLEGVILMNDYTLLVSRSSKLDYARDHLNELFGKKYPRNFRREHVSYRRDTPEELALSQLVTMVNERFDKNWRPQTISTYLAHLVRKNYLTMRRSGKVFLYHPEVTEEEYRSSQMDELVHYWGEPGTPTEFLSALFVKGEKEKNTEENLKDLRSLMDELD